VVEEVVVVVRCVVVVVLVESWLVVLVLGVVARTGSRHLRWSKSWTRCSWTWWCS